MKVLHIILLFCSWFTLGCDFSKDQDIIESFELAVLCPVIDDTKVVTDSYCYYAESEYRVLYHGKVNDTLWLSQSSRDFFAEARIPQTKFSSELSEQEELSSLIIYVDTSRIIPIPGLNNVHYFFNAARAGNEYRHTDPPMVMAYPVLIHNNSASRIYTGYSDYLVFHLTARDSTGKWSPIEQYFSIGCGTGLIDQYLQPDSSVITACRLYTGEYKTKMRLEYVLNPNIRSNEFEGYVDYCQFGLRQNCASCDD